MSFYNISCKCLFCFRLLAHPLAVPRRALHIPNNLDRTDRATYKCVQGFTIEAILGEILVVEDFLGKILVVEAPMKVSAVPMKVGAAPMKTEGHQLRQT